MRLTGLPYEVVCGWDEVEAELWQRAAAESLRQARDLMPDVTASLLEAVLAGGGP